MDSIFTCMDVDAHASADVDCMPMDSQPSAQSAESPDTERVFLMKTAECCNL